MSSNRADKIVFFTAIFFLLLFFQYSSAQSSDGSSKECPVKSLPEFFKKEDSIFVVKPLKNDFLLVLPVLSIQPANGFIYGAIGQYTFKDKRPDDKYSTAYLMAT